MENRSDSAKKAGKPSKGLGDSGCREKGRAPGARSEGKTQPRGSCARQRLAGAARASQRKAAKQQMAAAGPSGTETPEHRGATERGGGRVGQCAHRHRLGAAVWFWQTPRWNGSSTFIAVYRWGWAPRLGLGWSACAAGGEPVEGELRIVFELKLPLGTGVACRKVLGEARPDVSNTVSGGETIPTYP